MLVVLLLQQPTYYKYVVMLVVVTIIERCNLRARREFSECQNSVNLVKIINIMSLFCMAILDAIRCLKMTNTVVTHESEIHRILSKFCHLFYRITLLLIMGNSAMHS